MDDSEKMFMGCIIVACVCFLFCFLIYQVQVTNRIALEKGLHYGPISTTTYSIGWSKN